MHEFDCDTVVHEEVQDECVHANTEAVSFD